ncbi:ArsO family NAD(P)H-dependent flavin-containing monooxygenase [Paractinoplanes ferrugineus]|uniref:Dimethylaniline monooxygenase n=1 Tax=Paractinoplanes ferrugineus TaxID=113564 RepID=A0A919MIG0_9ACTN|nr:NAD(P)-binding domain-containing protein [Actinoplanes ferrugineus]GIE15979.1 dimethylaniline monooxygenase [Actinoplanes ferrugineus]
MKTDVAVLGAGPYGLAVSAALGDAGVEHQVLGEPMSFWKEMPEGMLLRSNWTATSIADHRGPVSLDAYVAATGAEFGRPVPLENFIAYGSWVQSRVAPGVDRRVVSEVSAGRAGFLLSFADGSTLRAGRVVVAAGIAPFARRPPQFAGLSLATHSAEHRDLSRFKGERVLVVGGGQSALESAALLHESGAEVEVLVRRDHLTWLHGGKYQRLLGRAKPLFYAPTDVGPLGLSRVVAAPHLFRRLPRSLQTPAARRAIRPAGAEWLVARLREVPIRLGFEVRSATEDGKRIKVSSSTGEVLTADHLIYGTGYQVDVARYPFLPPSLVRGVRRVDGHPVLGSGLESSVPGLHFVGAPAAWSYGPIMRFVSGGWFASRAVASRIAGRRR